jgi:CheY-like chemotaxis protein
MTAPDIEPALRLCVIGEADPFLAQLLQRFAEKSGYQAWIAQSGEAVLASAQQRPPDLVVLEPELPGRVRGWEAVQMLKDGEATRKIPVILCAWLNEDEAQALVGQALNHLQKPELHYRDFVDALAAAELSNGGEE